MLTDAEIKFFCQYCGYENTLSADLTGKERYEFVEVCSICKQPNRIIVSLAPEEGKFNVEAKPLSW